MSTVLHRPRLTGRHRLGRPGLVPLSALVAVRRRGFFATWFRPARHRHSGGTPQPTAPTRLTMATPALDRELELSTAA